MAQADSNNTTRRHFLSATAAGIAAGGTALALASPPASAADDPVFALIDEYNEARSVLREAEAAHILAERQMQADGSLFPRVVSIGNRYSGLPRPVSASHADIDMFTPVDLFPQDNKREHEELSAAILRRDVRIKPLQEAMDDAWDIERQVVEDLVQTVPTTIAGVLAMLKFQRDYSEDGECLDSDIAASLMGSVETGLLTLQEARS
jgi:hypothetical protein